MTVSTIYLLRHGHRLAWTLDPMTGTYSSSHAFPTRLPADPPLASHGVRQAMETGSYLSQVLAEDAQSGRLRIYSSLFYRCFETLRPTAEALTTLMRATSNDDHYEHTLPELKVRGESGIGEWFGHAWFKQPSPPSTQQLEAFFPWIDSTYSSRVTPNPYGERIEDLHDRVAKTLSTIVQDVEEEFEKLGKGHEHVTLLICGHAAQIICAGRALTGQVPEDLDEEDFYCYTCGLTKFARRSPSRTAHHDDSLWRTNGGVSGGWDCTLNSDCSHLSQGEERGWHFHGDESFDSYAASADRGVIVCSGESKL